MFILPALARHIPVASTVLFGDRARFGLVPDEDDQCWARWQQIYSEFYEANQRRGIGRIVNEAGYQVLRHFDFSGKTVLEIGPGQMPHIGFFKQKPGNYIVVDIDPTFLEQSAGILRQHDFPCQPLLTDRVAAGVLPLADASIDVVISFYALEHLYPLNTHLKEIRRVLKPGGHLVGAIPAEGGLAWGAGRYLTSRRWLLRNSSINPDKIICWEHPNFADDILRTIRTGFELRRLRFWPLAVPVPDINLIISFIAERK